MSLKIIPIGGYGEVGRNSTAIKVDDEIIILDLGLHLENYIKLTEDDDIKKNLSKRLLIKEKAIPDTRIIKAEEVKAIIISHAHLDHVGAVPYLANDFKCNIHTTKFTGEFLKQHLIDRGKEIKQEIKEHKFKKKFKISKKISAELVEVTHSTPQSAIIIIYTPYGNIAYINDFKLDEKPIIGKKTDLKYVAKKKIKALIIDTLYADKDEKTPSEQEAYEMLKKALITRDLKRRNIIITTFSSQIARIIEITKLAKKMKRKVMIVGRSMAKYLQAAKQAGITNIIEKKEVVKYGSKVKKKLMRIKEHEEYIFIVTGGMGEPNAVLSRMFDEELIPLKRNDIIVFSNRVIPTPTIIKAREKLERKISSYGIEILKDLHVSGHGAGKDIQEVIEKIKPEIIIPVHAEDETRKAFKKITKGKKVKILYNGEELILN